MSKKDHFSAPVQLISDKNMKAVKISLKNRK